MNDHLYCEAIDKNDRSDCKNYRMKNSLFCEIHTDNLYDVKDFFLVHASTFNDAGSILKDGYLYTSKTLEENDRENGGYTSSDYTFFSLGTPDSPINFNTWREIYLQFIHVFFIFNISMLNNTTHFWSNRWNWGKTLIEFSPSFSLKQNLNYLNYKILKHSHGRFAVNMMNIFGIMILGSIKLEKNLKFVYYPLNLRNFYTNIAKSDKYLYSGIMFDIYSDEYRKENRENREKIAQSWKKKYPQYKFRFGYENLEKYVIEPSKINVKIMPYQPFDNNFWEKRRIIISIYRDISKRLYEDVRSGLITYGENINLSEDIEDSIYHYRDKTVTINLNKYKNFIIN